MRSFRRKLWTSTYLGLEYYLPTSKRSWCREFVEMKIWNLQSLLVCWRSRLASLILNWCSILILLRRWWVNRFWYSWAPLMQFLGIRCWWRRIWICKNVSRYTMRVPNAWRPIFAARHSYRTASHSTRNWMRWERHRLTGNVGMSTAYWFSISKISWIIHTINFILQFLCLASEFKDSILVFDQSSSCNCVDCRTLKSLQFFHFIETFLMNFTKIPVLLQ